MNTSFESLADGVVVMSVRGDVDVFSAPAFKQQALACLECDVRRLIIDMSGSDLVDSTGAAAVFSVARRAWRGDVSVVCRDSLGGLFGIAGLDRVVGLYRTRSDALRGATQRSGPPHAQRRPSL